MYVQYNKKIKIKIYISNYLSPRKITFHGWSGMICLGFIYTFFPPIRSNIIFPKKILGGLNF